MKKMIALLLALVMVFGLFACKQASDLQPQGSQNAGSKDTSTAEGQTTGSSAEPEPTGTTKPSSSTATNITGSVPPPSSTTETPPENYWPETPENPSPDLLALTELFGAWGTLYNSALTSTYESPAFINLRFFLEGVSKHHAAQLTEEEQAAFADYGIENMEVFRYTREEVDEYLQQYFGITSADLDEIAVRNLNYLESTDCFYIFTNGWDDHVSGVNVIFTEPQADGTVLMYYTTNGWPAEKLIARIQPTDSGYIILSNLKV